LLEAIACTPGIAPYFDLSFQHASSPVLRRMKRYGSAESFLDILDRVRTLAPHAGARSNVIVGFPGETEDDVAELERFLIAARLDVVGVFGYSDEDGTAAAQFEGKVSAQLITERVERVTSLAHELMSQRAEDRVGSQVDILVEGVETHGQLVGRAVHQGPDVDGTTRVTGSDARRGQFLSASVVESDGIDLVADAGGAPW
jgi:ribosomal protein S12 methylthiotransferase